MVLVSVRERIIDIAEFDILQLFVLFRQDEKIAAGLLQV